MIHLNREPLVSLVIPIYNSAAFLDRCLNSIIDGTYQNIEVLLVDDGSRDNSSEILKRWAGKDLRIKAFFQNHEGTSAARNRGIENAKGEYLSFVDADDLVHPLYLSLLVETALKTEADVVVCSFTREGEPAEFLAEGIDDEGLRYQLVDKNELLKDTYLKKWTSNNVPWNKLYRKDIFDALRFPYGRGYEDIFTTYKALNQAGKIAVTDYTLYYWWKNPDSYSTAKTNPDRLQDREEGIREQVQYYWKTNREIAEYAAAFYLEQCWVMDYQLRYDYSPGKDQRTNEKRMRLKLLKAFLKYRHLATDENKQKYLEWLFPYTSAIRRRLKKQ